MLSSDHTFVFIVGSEKLRLTVHSRLFRYLSHPLNALVNGNMAEAQAGEATLPDVDADAFLALCEFAYSRDYTKEILRAIDAKDSPPEPCCESGDCGYLIPRKRFKDLYFTRSPSQSYGQSSFYWRN